MKIAIGIFLILFALLITSVEVIACIDPIATQMSDDANPFGITAQPWWSHAIRIAIILICSLTSLRLLGRKTF